MTVYRGGRSLEGAVVTVDGRPLAPRFDLKRLSTTGFEWTYEGAGPAQLALALLADHLGDDARALKLHEPFMRKLVAELEQFVGVEFRRYRCGTRHAHWLSSVTLV